MRLPPLAARFCMLVGAATAAGCGLTLDVDPPDLLDGSQAGFDGGGLDGGGFDGGGFDGGTHTQCVEDIDCDDTLHCNGAEKCVEGICLPGTPPCDAAPACTVSTCHEGSRACIASDVPCPSGQVCDPETGACGAPPACVIDSDCPDDGIECNGVFSCAGGACVAEAVPCADLDAIACTRATCTTAGCVELGDDTLCVDANPADCVVPRCTERGCIPMPVDRLCDDGIPCTTDACEPAMSGEATGCTHRPDDSMCASTTLAACGSMVCVGDRALTSYPLLSGCAPDLSSERCSPSAPHCVADDGTTRCTTLPSVCETDADCRDGNPCNGIEACVGGSCVQLTTSCPRTAGTSSWCDRSTGVPVCESRFAIAVTTP